MNKMFAHERPEDGAIMPWLGEHQLISLYGPGQPKYTSLVEVAFRIELLTIIASDTPNPRQQMMELHYEYSTDPKILTGDVGILQKRLIKRYNATIPGAKDATK